MRKIKKKVRSNEEFSNPFSCIYCCIALESDSFSPLSEALSSLFSVLFLVLLQHSKIMSKKTVIFLPKVLVHFVPLTLWPISCFLEHFYTQYRFSHVD